MPVPLVTIVTITKDDPTGLRRTLMSTEVWRALPSVEQIVVFAGGDVPVVADSSVRMLRQQSQGIAGAFNEGLAQALGGWVWFLNGGDRIDPRLSPDFLLALLGQSRADILIGGLTYEGETEPRAHPAGVLRWPPLLNWIPHPATLVRHRLFQQFGGFDERYSIAMDYEWWLRSISAGAKADVLSVPLAVFAPGGVSQQHGSKMIIEWERDDAIRRHGSRLWRLWVSSGIRLGRAWIAARLARGPETFSRRV